MTTTYSRRHRIRQTLIFIFNTVTMIATAAGLVLLVYICFAHMASLAPNG